MCLRDMEERRPWGDLVPDLLYNVAARLDSIGTYVTFASVCRSWRDSGKAAAGEFVPLHPPMLVHVLYPMEPSNPTLVFYDPLEKKVYRKHIQGFSELRFVRHSHGWLIMAHRQQHELVVILNPFTGAKIELQIPSSSSSDDRVRISDGTLSAPPTSSECSIFLVTDQHHVVFHRVGSTSWEWFPCPSYMTSSSILPQLFFIKDTVYAGINRRKVIAMRMSPSSELLHCSVFDCPFACIIEIGGQLWAVDPCSHESRIHSSQDHWTEAELGNRHLFICPWGCIAYDRTRCRRRRDVDEGGISSGRKATWTINMSIEDEFVTWRMLQDQQYCDPTPYVLYLEKAFPQLQSERPVHDFQAPSFDLQSELIHSSDVPRFFTDSLDAWLSPDAYI